MTAFSKLVAVSSECVGVNYVSTAFGVFAVNLHDHIRISEIEKFRHMVGLNSGSL